MVINVSVTSYHTFDTVSDIGCAQLLSGFIFPTDAL